MVSRRWALSLVFVAAASCAVSSRVNLASRTSNPQTKTFQAHGISFDYPGNWVAFDARSPGPDQAATQKSEDVVGLDDLNVVSITALVVPPSQQGSSAWSDEVISGFTQAFAESGIQVKGGPDKILVGGEKGIRWKIRQPSGVGYVLDTTLVVLFRGDTEYYVRCQHTALRASEMDRGCDQVLGTLHLGRAKS
jgi:hypothetical protein